MDKPNQLDNSAKTGTPGQTPVKDPILYPFGQLGSLTKSKKKKKAQSYKNFVNNQEEEKCKEGLIFVERTGVGAFVSND